MNKLNLSAIAAALALTAGAAQAASIAPSELKVVGVLDVPACTVTADSDGLYDHGDLDPTTVKPGTTHTALPSIVKRWAINCDSQTYLSFSVVDNAEGTESLVDNNRFGLGNVNGTGKIGYYEVQLGNAEVDGQPAHVYATNRAHPGDAHGATTHVRKGAGFQMGWAETAAWTQKVGRDFEVDMQVNTWIGGNQTMNGPLTDDASLEGSLTLNFAYGL